MDRKAEIVFTGSGVSPGVVLGQALKFDSHNRLILKVHVDDVEAEVRQIFAGDRSVQRTDEGSQIAPRREGRDASTVSSWMRIF